MAKRPDKSKGEDLNAQQRQFCAEYLIDFNGRQAAIRAGYKPNSAAQQASALLNNPNVAPYLTKLITERRNGALITVEEVITGLKEVKDRSLTAVPVLDYDGEPTGEYRFDSSGANRALELLGKYLRMWVERSEVVDVTSAKQFAESVLKIVLEEVNDQQVRDAIVTRVEALCGA